ncbi:hypothetical protein GCM10011365_16910 [Marinicella pacifica]|uniref:FUSC family protein n=1 Tax=Marinicella pacifica TaxID=1171543 RepID=A0A917CT13_9GAMM|nr:hypothetical protein [Marinicella pacifica]GGF96204.1 hypothetical protein GCM10011365_16910 [Marinicella pacifica]
MNDSSKPANQTDKNPSPSPIVNAFMIGFLVGIIIYSVAVNSWGFLTLIPLFLIYKLMQKPKAPKVDGEVRSSKDW